MATLDDVYQGTQDAIAGFKQMQTTLVIFCGLVAVGILIASISLFKTK